MLQSASSKFSRPESAELLCRRLDGSIPADDRVERLVSSRWPSTLSPAIVLLLLATSGFLATARSSAIAQEETLTPVAEIPTEMIETLEYFCLDCHSGSGADADLELDRLIELSEFKEGRDEWEKVFRMVRSRDMPPDDWDQPEEAERIALIEWIDTRLKEIDCGDGTFPGRVTIRRLNRVEYNNTIRDLTGVDFKPAETFPSDDVGNGFDNIGDVLVMPPLLVEKYLDAAEQVIDAALADERGRELILVCEPANNAERLECATRIISNFATRAYRRPITANEQARLLSLGREAFENGADYEETIAIVLQTILVSPNFLFKVELDPDENDRDGVRELNDYELAVRLSYFLWSSMPDEELFRIASEGRLQEDGVLAQQVRRMIADPKAEALVENFAGQWLQLRSLAEIQPSEELFPNYDAELQAALRAETEMFFRTMLQENRNILDFLTADFTFVNRRLAEHYGIEYPEDAATLPVAITASAEVNLPNRPAATDEMVRVSLPGNRRGVLTHASILLITSNPTRTSPVKRGKWILENILGEPPPPPPEDVQELEDQPELLGSLRERMEQHRENESCAVCHRTMDTLGFGLENFDVVGAWRDKDGRYDIDPAGALPGGVEFRDAGQLMQILADQKQAEFSRCLTEKMLTYAIGRGLDDFDRCAIDVILEKMADDENRLQTMIEAIVFSEPFRKRAATRERP